MNSLRLPAPTESQFTLRELFCLTTVAAIASAAGLEWIGFAIWLVMLGLGYVMARRLFYALMQRSPLDEREFVQEFRKRCGLILLGLMVAVGIGMYFATDVVNFIQGPVRDAWPYVDTSQRIRLTT